MQNHTKAMQQAVKVRADIQTAKIATYALADTLSSLDDYLDVDAVRAVRALLNQADTILHDLVCKHNDLAIELSEQD